MNSGKLLLSVFIQVFVTILVGLVFINSQIINPGISVFAYSIFAVFASVLFYVLKSRGGRDFIFVGILLSGLILLTWHNHASFEVLIRNILWYIFIGTAVYINAKILAKNSIQTNGIKSGAVWILSMLFVYLIMFFINIYIISTYPLTDTFGDWAYFKLAIKFGLCLGGGLGLGYILNKIFLEKSKLQWKLNF